MASYSIRPICTQPDRDVLGSPSDDYSSVTSADIDNALSADDIDDDDDNKDGGELLPPTTTGSSSRHVAFAPDVANESVVGDSRSLDASYAVRRSCFERGAVERQTLPAFTTSDLVSGLFFRRDMRSTAASRDDQRLTSRYQQQQQQRQPRSKSTGRTTTGTATPRKDVTSSSRDALDGHVVGSPITTSTPKSSRPVTSPVDDDAMRGERLSNYETGSLLVGRRSRAMHLQPSTVSALDCRQDGRRLLSGRRSVDAAMSPNLGVKHVSHDTSCDASVPDVVSSPYGYGMARRRCITPVNEPTSSQSMFAAYQLRRPNLPTSTGPSETAGSYLSVAAAAGRRSLPRNATCTPVSQLGCPTTSSQAGFCHNSHSVPYSMASQCVTASHHWAPSTASNTGHMPPSAAAMAGSSDNILHGSSLSLGSNTSSNYSNAEEMHAHEVNRLRRELEQSQAKIASLNTHINTNAHVVFAFEQSLSNMTQRLQRLAATTDQKDAELNELRSMLDAMRQQTGLHAPIEPLSESAASASVKSLRRHMSSDSVISAVSATSQQSIMSTVDPDRKKKKNKNWLSSFGKAFSRKKKAESMSDADSDASSLYADAALSVSGNTPHNFARNSCSDALLTPGGSTEAAMLALQQQLHEKDMRLTDVQLEALSSSHQLQQLQDTISRMKTEMLSLRVDNDRLNQLVKKGNDIPAFDSKTESCTEAADCNSALQSTSSEQKLLSDFDDLSLHAKNLDILVSEHTKYGSSSQPVTLSVRREHTTQSGEILLGKLQLDSKMSWDSLSDLATNHFKEYMMQLDPSTSLGLNEDSIYSFSIGDLMFGKGMVIPDLLPCGYLVGDNTNIAITLNGAEQNSVDSLAYDTLVPKSILQRYVSLLLEHRRIILCGSSGTGKTYLARRFAEHLIIRSGWKLEQDSIATFSVDTKSGRELRPYLSSVSEKCEQNAADLPKVIIIDGLHHISSPLSDAFNGFLSVDCKASPYIIGVMNQSSGSTTDLQLHHNFRWVRCANHMEPVQGFLGRYLRRRLLDAQVHNDADLSEMKDVVDWLPQVWQQINRLLETHGGSDVTVGPRLFMSCPMNPQDVPTWFSDLWNHSIVPYILNAVREGIQSCTKHGTWEDPVEWIVSTCPWRSAINFDSSTLQRIRPEDVGCNSTSLPASVLPSSNSNLFIRCDANESSDPLLGMLLRMKETTGCTSPSITSPASVKSANADRMPFDVDISASSGLLLT